jgi:hypothetical protein
MPTIREGYRWLSNHILRHKYVYLRKRWRILSLKFCVSCNFDDAASRACGAVDRARLWLSHALNLTQSVLLATAFCKSVCVCVRACVYPQVAITLQCTLEATVSHGTGIPNAFPSLLEVLQLKTQQGGLSMCTSAIFSLKKRSMNITAFWNVMPCSFGGTCFRVGKYNVILNYSWCFRDL